MATRTINFKMVLSRKERGKNLRRALWVTHEEINKATAEMERVLLLCRGKSYWTMGKDNEDLKIGEDEVKKEALKLAREAQRRNGKSNAGTDEEVLSLLFSMYRKIVPTVEQGGKGDAQASNTWVSPLMDKESDGGLTVFKKILDPSPRWIQMMRNNEDGWEEESKKWLDSADGKRLQGGTGSPPAWVRRLRKGETWQESFIGDQEKKQVEAESGIAPLIRELKKKGLLPLVSPQIHYRIQKKQGNVSKWDRLTVRLAVAHFLSWESWNHRTRAAHEKVKNNLEKQREKSKPYKKLIDKLREYEKWRQKELKKSTEASDERPYRIGKRAVRAWDRVLEQWRKDGKTKKVRKEILDNLQTKLQGKFGDPVLFNWLAEDGREKLWKENNPLPILVQLNSLQMLLERKKEHALCTPPDPRQHPRWASYEAPGGTNLRQYDLKQKNGRAVLELRLLAKKENGTLKEEQYEIPLAPSGQLQNLKIKRKKKALKIYYKSAGQDFSGKPGGSEILFDRRFMENRAIIDNLAQGNIGPVWFKLTLDVDPKGPKEWFDKNGKVKKPPEAFHFGTGLAKKSEYADKVTPGLRILSVDLGLRAFASCSVFELVNKEPERGLYFSTDLENLWARHERSFTLQLPGEKVHPGNKVYEERQKAFQEIYSLRRDIKRLRDILRMGIEEDKNKRKTSLEALQKGIHDEGDANALNKEILAPLSAHISHAPVLWKGECQKAFNESEKRVSMRFSAWRKRTRPRSANWQDWRERRAYQGGKSIWMLEYLDAVRKLLKSWSLRGREQGQVNRWKRDKQGEFASGLLSHINQLKGDRVKTGSDMIIQAARGYIPAGTGWTEKYSPCRLILFEDLARYRFQTDRPRRENSQLMKWNHREITKEVEMQAQIYGIFISTTAAGFSSRYHAATNAPGVRCRRLWESDFDKGKPREYVKKALGILGNISGIQPGTLVPWEGGEQFATLVNGKPIVIHADLNAAQNLQRRFWTRCADAYRLPCVKATINGSAYWYPERDGTRLRGALAQMEEVGDNGYCRLEYRNSGHWFANGINLNEWKKATGDRKKSGDEEGEDEVEEALSMEISVSDEHETFFHDPSGEFFEKKVWVPAKNYWGKVKGEVWNALRKHHEKSYTRKK